MGKSGIFEKISPAKRLKGRESLNRLKERDLLRKLSKTKIYRFSDPNQEGVPFDPDDFLGEEYDEDALTAADC